MPILRGRPHRGIDYKFDFFSEFEFIFKTALGMDQGIGGRVLMKKKQKRGKISRVSVPLSTRPIRQTVLRRTSSCSGG
jgi:hypothetical protein